LSLSFVSLSFSQKKGKKRKKGKKIQKYQNKESYKIGIDRHPLGHALLVLPFEAILLLGKLASDCN